MITIFRQIRNSCPSNKILWLIIVPNIKPSEAVVLRYWCCHHLSYHCHVLQVNLCILGTLTRTSRSIENSSFSIHECCFCNPFSIVSLPVPQLLPILCHRCHQAYTYNHCSLSCSLSGLYLPFLSWDRSF